MPALFETQSNSAKPAHFWLLVGIACLLGGVARILAVALIPTQPVSDFWVYLQGALELERSGRYPLTWFPPGYPLVLAGGLHLAPDEMGLLAAKSVNLFLSLGTILLTALTAKELAGERVGAWAAFGLALFPRAILQPCLLASENLFAPLLLLLTFVLLRGLRREGAAWSLAAAAGAVVAGLALTRPVGYLLGALWLARGISQRRRWWRVAGELVVLLAVQHALMIPWALHNHRHSGRMAFLTPVGGIDMLVGVHPDLHDGRATWEQVLKRLDPSVDLGKNQFELDDAARRAAVRWIVGNPGETLRLYGRKLAFFFKGEVAIVRWVFDANGFEPPSPPIEALPGEHLLKHHLRAVRRTVQLTTYGLFLLAALGTAALLYRALGKEGERRTKAAAFLLFLAFALYFPLITCVFHVSDRYRWPMEDCLFPVAAFACVIAERRWRQRFVLRQRVLDDAV